MNIQIENQQEIVPIDTLMLRTVAKKILDVLACPEAELSILLVDDLQIREINRDYLQRDKSTNVISFAMQEGEGAEFCPDLLGDVVISVETARRDAADAGVAPLGELAFLLLHGVLHLLGYDHERGSEEEARLMEGKEREVFAVLEEHFDFVMLSRDMEPA